MQISISTRHGHLSTGTQESITAKVEKLERFHDRLSVTEVIVDLARQGSSRCRIPSKCGEG